MYDGGVSRGKKELGGGGGVGGGGPSKKPTKKGSAGRYNGRRIQCSEQRALLRKIFTQNKKSARDRNRNGSKGRQHLGSFLTNESSGESRTYLKHKGGGWWGGGGGGGVGGTD